MRRPSLPRGYGQRRRRQLFGYIMVLPTFGLTFLFTIFPLMETLFRSFYTGNLFSSSHVFAGLANYAALVQSGGIASLGTTAVYTLGFVTLATVLGLLSALLLNLPLPGGQAVRTLFIIPLVVPVVATAIVWVTLFNPYFGAVDALLRFFGMPSVNWLTDPRFALPTVIMFSTWQYLGQNVILFLAGLKAISREVLEQASVDGAFGAARFFRVTLPLIMPTVAVIVVIATINALQTFTQIYVITRGGPVGSTTTAAFYVYQQAFQFYNTGTADAMASIIFAITLVITVLETRMLRRVGAEGHA